MDVHLVMDNYGTHQVDRVRGWLARHPRYHVHCTPTSASWLNLAERWFAELTSGRLRRSAHLCPSEPEKRHPQMDQRVEQAPQAIRMDQVRR